MRPPQRTPEELHQYQHDLIASRKGAWLTTPKRERPRRRERGKAAWWTLTGHLRGLHQVRGGNPFLGKTWDEVEAMHLDLHKGS